MGGGASDALTHVLFGLEVVAIGLMIWQAATLANLPLSRHTPAFTFPADVAARSVIVYTSLVLDTSGSSFHLPPLLPPTSPLEILSLHVHVNVGTGLLL
jgi:hypothetical protein